MTRAADEVTVCLELRNQGLNATQISRDTRIPRATVRDWIHGRVPGSRNGHAGPVCPECGHPMHVPQALTRAYPYLLGVYLGDGCISSHPRGVFRLRLFLDAHHPQIVEEVVDAVRAVRPHNVVGRLAHACNYVKRTGKRSNCVEVCSYSKSWPCLFPQHGPGQKHLRRIVLADWQQSLVDADPRPLLRGLIHSDGCRFINKGRGGWQSPRYAFSNLSDDIRGIFCDACDLLGLRWTEAGKRTIYVSRKADVARMDEFIGPKT